MPIPREHLEQLERRLPAHEQELRAVRAQIKAKEVAARVHETILQFGRDEKSLGAVAEFYDNPDLAAEVAKQPKAHFRKEGIRLPPDTEVDVVDASRQSTVMEGRVRQRDASFKVRWTREEGLAADPL